jgi:hypothetical protein
MTLTRQTISGVGVAAAALTAALLAVANFVGTETSENGGVPEYAITLGFSLLIALALFGWVIPRSERPARAGLIVGLLGALSVAAFWTGLPFVLGPAAVVLGLLGRARSEGGTATFAAAVGALATLAGVAAVVLDQML